tara:strand:- start:167 stop:355 length:189 start_codon:yes stop_codon:yes gene_type:complete
MTDDRRTLTDRFYFTGERLERRGNPFGNDPKNYTDFILRIIQEFLKLMELLKKASTYFLIFL